MRSKTVLLFYMSFVISFYCVSSSSSSDNNPNVVNDTLKLLADGEKEIQLLPNHKDIVLVIGNSGAGKTTITKFLTTDGSDMEAYRKGGRILIRDRAGKIGTNSTVKSQTIYPELMIHPETGVAFYDMPGFGDTRNAAIPIANAFFMKKVAEHAERVKIVFVVSHNSVLAGGYRGDFLNMIKGANGLIKDIRKFSPGVGLIVTKVTREDDEGIPEIVQYVAEFLEEVREAVPKVMEKAEDRERAIDLLDSLFFLGGNITGTGQNSTSSNEKIGIFLQPTKLGPLLSDPDVQKSLPLLKSIIFNKTEFVKASASDFGIIVEPQVQVLVSNLSRQVLDQLHSFSKSLAQLLQKYYENMTISVRGTQNLVQRLNKDLTRLQIEVLELGRSNSISEFISYLLENGTFPELSNKNKLEIFPEMRKLNSRLRFFEEIVMDSDGGSLCSGLEIWLVPFEKVMTFVHEQKLWKLKEWRHDMAHGYAKKGYWLCSLSLLIPPSSLFGCPIGVAIAHRSLTKLEEKQELVYHRKKRSVF